MIDRVCGVRVRFPSSAALLSLTVAGAPGPLLAQAERSTAPELRTADDEFSRQLSELKKTFGDLSKKFEESAQSIDRLESAEAARKEIEDSGSTSAGCSGPSPTTARCGASGSRR